MSADHRRAFCQKQQFGERSGRSHVESPVRYEASSTEYRVPRGQSRNNKNFLEYPVRRTVYFVLLRSHQRSQHPNLSRDPHKPQVSRRVSPKALVRPTISASPSCNFIWGDRADETKHGQRRLGNIFLPSAVRVIQPRRGSEQNQANRYRPVHADVVLELRHISYSPRRQRYWWPKIPSDSAQKIAIIWRAHSQACSLITYIAESRRAGIRNVLALALCMFAFLRYRCAHWLFDVGSSMLRDTPKNVAPWANLGPLGDFSMFLLNVFGPLERFPRNFNKIWGENVSCCRLRLSDP
jgi:hypothetical protein